MTFQDKTLTCRECAQDFTFSVEEQEFHQQKGYTNEPKRCPNCRETRRSNRFGGGGSARGYGRQMYPIVCAQCGQEAEVPFLPRGDRPVYCSNCYSSQGTTRRY